MPSPTYNYPNCQYDRICYICAMSATARSVDHKAMHCPYRSANNQPASHPLRRQFTSLLNISAINSLLIHSDIVYPVTSDHYLISFILSYHQTLSNCTIPTYVYDHCKADYEGLCQYLINSDLTCLYNHSDPNQAWTFVRDLITTGMDQFIPKAKLKHNQYPTWFSPLLRHQVKCMRTLRKKLRNHFTMSSLQRLIRMEENFQTELSKAKLNYEQGLINNFAYNRIPRYFITSATLRMPNLCLLYYSMVHLKLSQTRKRHTCSTSISIQFLRVVTLSYLTSKNCQSL